MAALEVHNSMIEETSTISLVMQLVVSKDCIVYLLSAYLHIYTFKLILSSVHSITEYGKKMLGGHLITSEASRKFD